MPDERQSPAGHLRDVSLAWSVLGEGSSKAAVPGASSFADRRSGSGRWADHSELKCVGV